MFESSKDAVVILVLHWCRVQRSVVCWYHLWSYDKLVVYHLLTGQCTLQLFTYPLFMVTPVVVMVIPLVSSFLSHVLAFLHHLAGHSHLVIKSQGTIITQL